LLHIFSKHYIFSKRNSLKWKVLYVTLEWELESMLSKSFEGHEKIENSFWLGKKKQQFEKLAKQLL